MAATLFATCSFADMSQWKAVAETTSGNVVADDTGWTFSGSGTATNFDYGNLDADGDDRTVDQGATIEYVVDVEDNGSSICIGSILGWDNNEHTTFKLEQWNNTGLFGITLEGSTDYTYAGASSIFDKTAHICFVNQVNGHYDLYINGVLAGSETNHYWVSNGGSGMLGGSSSGGGVPSGKVLAVASYNRALTASEISALYAALPPRRISIAFTDGGPGPGIRDAAGVTDARAFHWNIANWTSDNFKGQNGTDINNLVDSAGITSGVSVADSGSGAQGQYWNSSGNNSGDQNMMVNFIQTDGNLRTLTFSDISYPYYDVYVYTLPDVTGEARMGQFTIGSRTFYTQTDDSNWRNTGYAEVRNSSVATANANPGNTIRFRGVSGASFDLEFGAAAGSSSLDGILCGLQIVHVHPNGTILIIK
jgi:hypothetical protein